MQTHSLADAQPSDDSGEHASLIPIIERGGAFLADSRLVAGGLTIQHHNLLATIQTYLDRIEAEFGIVLFETEQLPGPGRPERFALLSEDQALFVATLSRNSAEVVTFKARLVKAFAQARRQLPQAASPDLSDPLVVAKLYVESETARRKAEAAQIVSTDLLIRQAPAVDFAQRVEFGEADLNIGTFAEMIGVKHLFRWLREHDYLYHRAGHNVPHARYGQHGQNLFHVKLVPKNGRFYPVTSITGKGQLRIAKELGVGVQPTLELVQ